MSLGPLDRVRGFLQEKVVAPLKNKKTPYETEQRRASELGKGIQGLRQEATDIMRQIKDLRASVIKGDQMGLARLNKINKELSLIEISSKINQLDIKGFPKNQQKEIAAAKKEIAKFVAAPVKEMEKEVSKLVTKKRLNAQDQVALRSLIGRFQEFSNSHLNDKKNPTLQTALFNIQKGLGKAILKANEYDESPGMIALFLERARFDSDSPGFDFQGFRLALDYIFQNPARFSLEQRGEAGAILHEWEQRKGLK